MFPTHRYIYSTTTKDQFTANDLPLSPELRKSYNVNDDGKLHMENFLAKEYRKFISKTEPYFHPWNHIEGEGAHMVITPMHMFETPLYMLQFTCLKSQSICFQQFLTSFPI